jgi:hypothetical protein
VAVYAVLLFIFDVRLFLFDVQREFEQRFIRQRRPLYAGIHDRPDSDWKRGFQLLRRDRQAGGARNGLFDASQFLRALLFLDGPVL